MYKVIAFILVLVLLSFSVCLAQEDNYEINDEIKNLFGFSQPETEVIIALYIYFIIVVLGVYQAVGS